MLDKMGGTWAPRPSTGPHKLRECLPLCLILRNRLKYALTKKECQQICMLRLVKVDGRVRTDPNFPCGFNDVISLDKTDEHFRMMFGVKGIPYVSTHDGRTIRYPDPLVRVHDVIKVDLATGKMTDIITFETGT